MYLYAPRTDIGSASSGIAKIGRHVRISALYGAVPALRWAKGRARGRERLVFYAERGYLGVHKAGFIPVFSTTRPSVVTFVATHFLRICL